MLLNYTFLAILLTPLTLVFAKVDPRTFCPPNKLIDPCKCQKTCNGCYVTLLCEGIQEYQILTQSLNHSNDYQYETFELKNSFIMYIPYGIFQAKKIKNMYVIDSKLVSLFDHPPYSEDLDVLVLERVRLNRGFQWELFSKLTINRLNIHHTPLRYLSKSFSMNMPSSIEHLIIFNCSISKLDDLAFSKLTSTTAFDFQKNNINELKRSMFPIPSKVESIDFSENKIESLPEDIFTDMPHLRLIFIFKNLLYELDEGVFGKIFPQLKILNLDDNPIECRCKIRWIITANRKNFYKNTFMGNCASPDELEGLELSKLKKEDFPHCG